MHTLKTQPGLNSQADDMEPCLFYHAVAMIC